MSVWELLIAATAQLGSNQAAAELSWGLEMYGSFTF